MKLKSQFRDLEFRQVNEKDKTIELSFSSEEPYERYWGVEILDHSTTSVNMERLNNSAPLLFNHDRDVVIGVVEFAKVEDKRGLAKVRFGNSEKAKEVFSDVVDGIMRNVSVGYSINEMRLESESDGVETYRVTDWLPFEISIVSIPADATIGVGRESQLDEQVVKILNNEVKSMDKNTKNQEETLNEEVKQEETQEATTSNEETPNEDAKSLDVEKVQTTTLKQERERVAEIGAIGTQFNVRKIADEAVASGMSVAEFREKVMKEMGKDTQINTNAENGNLGLTQNEIKAYSLGKALRAQITGDWSGAEYELELSRAVEKLTGVTAQGFYVPHDVLSQRDLTVANSGDAIVGTEILGANFIDVLRDNMIISKLGGQVLTGLVGNVSIPKQLSSANTQWIVEGGEGTQDDLTLGFLPMSPKTINAITGYSRQMLLQGNPSVDAMVLNDLALSLAQGIDAGALNGTGADGQPKGILNTTGIGAVTGITSLTYAKAVEFETKVNASNAKGLNYVMNATTAGTAKTTPKVDGQPIYIMDNGQINGYDVEVTNALANNKIIFGDFSQVITGLWGGLDIITERNAKTGGYTISAFQSVDIGVRHAQSFSAGTIGA